MDNRMRRLAFDINTEYACYSVADAMEKIKGAIDINIGAFTDLFLSLNDALMIDKVLHPWGRGIYRRDKQMNQWDGVNDFVDFPKYDTFSLTKNMVYKSRPWYRRLIDWLFKSRKRLTYRKTISSVRFIVPPGYPDDTYSIEDSHRIE